MRPIADSLLTPDERRSEVASILAAGVLRLCARTLPATGVPSHSAPENPAKSGRTWLEVPAETAVGVLGKAGRGEKRNDLAVPFASLEVRWYLT